MGIPLVSEVPEPPCIIANESDAVIERPKDRRIVTACIAAHHYAQQTGLAEMWKLHVKDAVEHLIGRLRDEIMPPSAAPLIVGGIAFPD